MSIHSIALEDVRHSNFNPTSLEDVIREAKARESRKRIAAQKLKATQEPVHKALPKPETKPLPTTEALRLMGKRYLAQIQQKRADEKREEYEERQRLELQSKLDKIVEQRIEAEQRHVSMQQIALEVAKKYIDLGVTYSQLFSPQRSKEIVAARQECFYRCGTETRNSLPAIGRYFGGKDHTTVLHGIRKYKELQNDPSTKAWLPVEYIIPAEVL